MTNNELIELAENVVDQMKAEDKKDFVANPKSWREGLDITCTVNVSTGEQLCDVDDLIMAMLDVLDVDN